MNVKYFLYKNVTASVEVGVTVLSQGGKIYDLLSTVLVETIEDSESESGFIFSNSNHFSKRLLSRRRVDGDFLFFLECLIFKTTAVTELSAHFSSKHCPLSQALLLGIGAESGKELSFMDLFVQHTCRQIVPFVFVIDQAGGSNVFTLTKAWIIRCNWSSNPEKSGVSIFLSKFKASLVLSNKI